jgi:predicted DNA-binding protein (MmcQ/YjbR family)
MLGDSTRRFVLLRLSRMRGDRFCGGIVGAMAGARDKVLAFALSLPGAVEAHPWGEDVVKVRGKIFVFVGSADSRRISVKLAESHADALAIDGSRPTGYGLGKAGWVTVPVRGDGVSIAVLRDWVEESYRIVAPRRLVAALDSTAA